MALAITTASLPQAQNGVAYSTTLVASGGTTPYTWAILSGSLPPGLSLNASTGVISGTPTAVVPANQPQIEFEVTDSATPTPATATANLGLAVTGSVVPVGSATPNPNASPTFPLMPQCWPLTVVPGSDPVSAEVPPLDVPQQPDPTNTQQNDVISTALEQSGNSGNRLA
jgi:Putative Ig domain